MGEHPVFRDMPVVGDWERPVTLPPLSFEARPGSVISFDPERFRGSSYDVGDGCGGEVQELESTKRRWSVVLEESSSGISVESGSASGSAGSWNSEDAREKELRYKRELRQLRRRRERIGKKKASLQKKVALQALLLQRLEKEQDGVGDQQDAESAQYNECSMEGYESECERSRHLPRASSAPLPLFMSGAQDANDDSVADASVLARPQTTLFFTGKQEQHSLAPRPFSVPRWWWRRGKWGANKSKSPKNSGAAENKRNVDGSGACAPSEPGDISKQSEQQGKLRKRQKGISDGEEKLKCMEREALQAILDFSTAVLKTECEHQGKLEHTSGPKEHAWRDRKDELSIPLRSLSLGRSFSKKKTYQHVEDRSGSGTGDTRLSRELVRSLSLRQTISRKSKTRAPESERGYTDALNEVRGSSSLRRRRKKIPAPLEQTRSSYEDDVLDTEEEQLTGESVLQREERSPTRSGPEYFPVVNHGHVNPVHRPTDKAQVAFPTIPRDQSETYQAPMGHPRPQILVPLRHHESYAPEGGDRGTQWSYFLASAEFPKPPSCPPHLCTCTLHRPTRPPLPSRMGRLPLSPPLTVGPEGYRPEELPLSSGASTGPPLHVIPEAEEWDTVISQAHEGVHQGGNFSSVPDVGSKTGNHTRSRDASKTVNSPIKEGSRTTLQTGICSDYEGIKAATNKNYGNKRSPDMSLGVDTAADSEAGREDALEDARRLCSRRNSSSTMEMYHTGSTSKMSTTDLRSATSVEFPITAVAQEAEWHIQKMGSTAQPARRNENGTRPNVEMPRREHSLNEECSPPPDERAYEQRSKAEAVKPPEDEAFAKFMNAQARLANRTNQPANSLPTFLRGYHDGGNGSDASAKQARQDSANDSVTLPVGRHSSSGE
ncbi:hypothetical protein MPH_05897 [Macrophomina phaseolina MS6]|uniref:Uncharacterized protein n=1 Tax=Macrophomina phaseolina (strain MS6) TaxID=1126212 RepID=K2R3L4_MACPH|nr:hypothetical protein MPH_05897 [Macrophomina phaseolina MS6]